MEVAEGIAQVEVEIKIDGSGGGEGGGGDAGDAGGHCCLLLLLLILSFLPSFFRMGFHIAHVSLEFTV